MPAGEMFELLDAETEFRRRLAIKLTARGYEGPALEQKIAELLAKPVNLRLDVEGILRG
jgi:hypothetical protein